MTPNTITHAMTVDVEDYYHVSAFESAISPTNWHKWPSRVERNTQVLLELFARKNIKATFFVLGWVAERFPSLITRIDQLGHEIASHGYSHQLVYKQTPDTFREETAKSKKILEDLTGKTVEGYRAASYSITAESLWALDILYELGFSWDSSIFPVRHDRYGMIGTPESPYTILTRNGGKLREFPLTTAKVFGLAIPAAGGGYFRQYPYSLSKWLFNRASQENSQPVIFYLHPWEIDPEQPRVPNASWLSRFRHYSNLHRCEDRLQQLLDDFSFSSVSNSLAQADLTQELDLNQYQHGY